MFSYERGTPVVFVDRMLLVAERTYLGYGKITRWGTPMFGNLTALEGLHVTGKYRNRSMQHTCSMRPWILSSEGVGRFWFVKGERGVGFSV